VILVIYGCFWLFLSPILVATNCIKTACVNFEPYKPGGSGFRGLRGKKIANNFGMHRPPGRGTMSRCRPMAGMGKRFPWLALRGSTAGRGPVRRAERQGMKPNHARRTPHHAQPPAGTRAETAQRAVPISPGLVRGGGGDSSPPRFSCGLEAAPLWPQTFQPRTDYSASRTWLFKRNPPSAGARWGVIETKTKRWSRNQGFRRRTAMPLNAVPSRARVRPPSGTPDVVLVVLRNKVSIARSPPSISKDTP